MKRLLIDTDVLIDFTKGHDETLSKLLSKQFQGDLELVVSPVNITEFFNNQLLEIATKHDEAQEFINLFSVSAITKSTGLLAGDYLRENKTEYLGDALVAATCVSEKLALVTRNTRHFKKIKKLELFKA